MTKESEPRNEVLPSEPLAGSQSGSNGPSGSPPLGSGRVLTVGETLLGRELAKEQRAGVEHYVPGQREAVLFRGREYGSDRPCEIGRITYVDQMGHACVVLAFRLTDEPDEWRATWVGRAGQTWKSEARQVKPDEFPLSEGMLAALAAAPYEEATS